MRFRLTTRDGMKDEDERNGSPEWGVSCHLCPTNVVILTAGMGRFRSIPLGVPVQNPPAMGRIRA
jgi:hypothetical protein